MLTTLQIAVLATVATSRGNLDAYVIANHLGVVRPAVQRAADELEKSGLVRGYASAITGRQYGMTTEGRAALAALPDVEPQGTRTVVAVCDLAPGDLISNVDTDAPMFRVASWDGSNLTVEHAPQGGSAPEGHEPFTMHLVDYLDAVARYAPTEGAPATGVWTEHTSSLARALERQNFPG